MYLSCGVLEYPELGVVRSRAEQIEEFFVVELQKGHSDRVFLNIVGIQLLKQLVERARDYSSHWILVVSKLQQTSDHTEHVLS